MNDSYSNYIIRVSLVITPFFLFGISNGIYNSHLYTMSPWLFWLADVLGWVVLPSAILVYLYRCFGIGLHDYGLIKLSNSSQRREVIIWSFFATFILSVYYFSFDRLAWEFIDSPTNIFNYREVVPQGNIRYVAIIYLAVTAAVFEEIFFRGLIWRLVYSSSIKYNKAVVYIAISSILFGLVHWEVGLPAVISAVVFGIVACVLYLRLRNLLPLIIAHFFIDIVSFW